MKLICQKCNKMPFIKICYIDEGKIIISIKCKCGKKFDDLTTFIIEYTDININNKQNEEEIYYENDIIKEDLFYFCETCFENIYNDSSNHSSHKIIKINKEYLINKDKLDIIHKGLLEAENKVKEYLPQMRDMLLNDTKDEKEKNEIKNYSELTIEKNELILKLLKLIYNIYIKEKKLTYQIIQNLTTNSDYNLNRYNLDLKSIEKDKFTVFLKYCLIICCNHSLNRVYLNYSKDKEELKKIILNLPYKEEYISQKEMIKFQEEMMKSNNSIYYGEKNILNNMAEGRGFLYFSSGTYYLGYFKHDVFKEGFGKSINKKGSIYIGQYKEGAANGVGKLKSYNGNMYEGYWTDNKLDIFGMVKLTNGKNYIGEMKEGFYSGVGILQYKNGNIYKGNLIEGKMDGIGVFDYANKKHYEGQFKEGSKNDLGIMTWPTGEKYEGSWIKDSYRFGTYYWPNGNIYIGNFNGDGVNGYGSFYSSLLGTIESGIWKSGKRDDIYDKETIPSTRYLSFL